MSLTLFDAARFRARIPAFQDQQAFPDDLLQGYFDTALCYVGNADTQCLNGDCLELALFLMTAHLCQIAQLIQQGKEPQIPTSASVGSVSVSVTPPPTGTSQWAWWLNTTPYGQQFQALLSGLVAGGLYLNGRGERRAFRKIGGRF